MSQENFMLYEKGVSSILSRDDRIGGQQVGARVHVNGIPRFGRDSFRLKSQLGQLTSRVISVNQHQMVQPIH